MRFKGVALSHRKSCYFVSRQQLNHLLLKKQLSLSTAGFILHLQMVSLPLNPVTAERARVSLYYLKREAIRVISFSLFSRIAQTQSSHRRFIPLSKLSDNFCALNFEEIHFWTKVDFISEQMQINNKANRNPCD